MVKTHSAVRIGVLALQGAFAEHMQALAMCGCTPVAVRSAAQLDGLSGIVLPGGESTVMGRLLQDEGMLEILRDFCCSGLPVLGTCAGLILLASDLPGFESQPRLGVLDISVRRNAFGRQSDSFETELDLSGLDNSDEVDRIKTVFIRAPVIERTGRGVSVLAKSEGRTVAVRKDCIVGMSFHPELTDDLRFHHWMVQKAKKNIPFNFI